MSLTGKVAIVTGSSRSIGAAIAKRLASDGANVVVNYSGDVAGAESVVSEINGARAGAAVAIRADVSSVAGNEQLVADTLKAFGKIDIVVLNAGIMKNKALQDIDEAMFDQHFNVNVKGPLFLVKFAAPHLTPGGRVIFFSSSLTQGSAVTPEYLTYVATKGAVEQMCRTLAKDLGRRGITVNTVSPGPIDTALFREGKPEQALKFIASLHPAGRIGQPDDVSPVVSMLASAEAAWVNGQNILVNGGFVV